MKDGIFTQYWDLACSIISDAENNGQQIKSSLLAWDMYGQLDPKQLSPEIVQFGVHQYCVQIVGKVCREKWGDTRDPLGAEFKKQLEFKEFGSRLQARYAVQSGKETEYKKIDELSYIERRRISKKLGELSQSYAEHKDQFDLYFRRKDKAA